MELNYYYYVWTIERWCYYEISKNILNEIIRSIDEYPVTLITGARQVGKSTLASYFEEKGYRYITFDDTDLLAKAKENPKMFILI